MKILYVVIDGKISGGNNICATLLRAALKEGYEVELLTPSLGPLTESLMQEGIPIHILGLTRSFYVHQSFRLARLLKKRQIDLVHTHTSLNPEILCRIACFLARVPIICHQHDPTDYYHPNLLIAWYQRWLDRLTSHFVARFIAVSKYRCNAMVRGRGYRRDQVHLIYNGIDIGRFASRNGRESVRQEWALGVDETAIGLIGRLEPSKGQETLIEAIPLVRNQFPRTRFFLIGGDHRLGQPSLLRYQRLIQKLGLEKVCFFLGFCHDVERMLRGLDLVVLPSWWEGHPLALLEAMAAGKPVIASSVGGVPEIVSHKKTGLLIPSQNPQALSKAICELLGRPKWARELASNAYEEVSKRFDQSFMLNQVLSLYQDLESSFIKGNRLVRHREDRRRSRQDEVISEIASGTSPDQPSGTGEPSGRPLLNQPACPRDDEGTERLLSNKSLNDEAGL